MTEPDYDAPGARLALMKDRYLAVMGRDGRMDLDAPEGRFTLRLWDGMDGCWCDCVAGDAQEVLKAWHERTRDGTEKTSFNDIDYFKIFPAESRMHWDGSEGREMMRGGAEPAELPSSLTLDDGTEIVTRNGSPLPAWILAEAIRAKVAQRTAALASEVVEAVAADNDREIPAALSERLDQEIVAGRKRLAALRSGLAIASKELRLRTGCSAADCDAAIVEAEGDVDAALEIILKKKLVRATAASPTAQGLWGIWMRLEHWGSLDGGHDLVGTREEMIAKAAEWTASHQADVLAGKAEGIWYEARPYDGNDPASSPALPPTLLRMPDGRMVRQGGPEDRATWWTCQQCHFTGPAVGSNERGEHVCMGILCGGKTMNPAVPRLPEAP
jgi:hypothetical protein